MSSPATTVFAAVGTQNFFHNDLEILNYALTLEHLENAFYELVNASGILQGAAASDVMVIGAHEQLHVDALTATIVKLGGTPVEPQAMYRFDVLGDLTTQAGILAIPAVLEHTGVTAYDGAAPEIEDKLLLAVAGQIVNVEARHTAVIRALIDPNANPVPLAFEQAATPEQTLQMIQPILG